MLIDVILDRKDEACDYSPNDFYRTLMGYGRFWPDIMHPISRAMDCGTETDVKLELVRYIIEQEYNTEIAAFICSVDWLEPETYVEAQARRERERIDKLWRDGKITREEAVKKLQEMGIA